MRSWWLGWRRALARLQVLAKGEKLSWLAAPAERETPARAAHLDRQRREERTADALAQPPQPGDPGLAARKADEKQCIGDFGAKTV